MAGRDMEQGCERSLVPTESLLAGRAGGTSAAFDSTQAQEGDPGSPCLDNPPSATLCKAPGPSPKPHMLNRSLRPMRPSCDWRSENEEKKATARKLMVR